VADTPAPETLEGERKTVTALFADIKGSMDLMEDLDPEEARALVDPALKLMIDAVHHYEGYVAQSTGDGVFAMFGAPVAHEDHPQRALYAAVRMQEELKRYSDRIRAEGRLPIQARVGVNTGEVVVRSITTGEGRSEYVPVGHSTGIAARMQALAPVGSIAATEHIRKLCEGYFVFKSLGPTKVKGVSELATVYEVTGLGPLRTRLQRAAGRGLTKFVGRKAEMEALTRVAELAKAGHGQIVAAVAEPGVGKSRLFHEFKATSQSGWLVLDTLSLSHDKATAYVPLIDLLYVYFRISRDDNAPTRREKVAGKIATLERSLEQETLPHLFALLGIAEGEDPLAQMDAQVRRRRTQDAVKRILLRESLNQPLMLIFEDLHLIDEETQRFLYLLSDAIGNAPVLLLVSYRPEYSHQWGGKTYYTQLRLDPLPRDRTEEMLAALLGSEKSLSPLKRLVFERTAGNPFFIEELITALFDEGVLVKNGIVQLTRAPSQLKIPSTVQGILAARMDRLRREEKELLQTLAVIGMKFSFSLVRGVFQQPRERLDRLLNCLQTAEFIYEQPATADVEYVFKHPLTQEVAYKSLLLERRKLLHGRVGAAIEGSFAQSIDDHLSELAHHYSCSSNAEKAVEYLERAGNQLAIGGAFKQAEIHYQQAISCLRLMPDTPEQIRHEFNLHLALVITLSSTTGYTSEETTRVLRQLKELSRKIGNPDQAIFTLAVAYMPLIGRDEVSLAQRIADQMLEIALQTGSNVHLTIAHQHEAQSHLRLGHLNQAIQHFEAVLASYHQSDFVGWPSDPKAYTLSWMGILWWYLGMADRARTTMREAISWSERNGGPLDLVEALGLASHLYIALSDSAKVQEFADRQLAIAREREWPTQLELASAFRGLGYGTAG
jgi:class 3 adenylate cyclase/tetratricopeptide (TPR) repeat protein